MRIGVLRGLAALALVALTACSAPAATGSDDAVPEVSRRLSECSFRVVLSRWTGLPDASGEAVLDQAAGIAKRTGMARINPSFDPEESGGSFEALNAVARVHGERVRALLAARGVANDPLPDTVLVSHPQATRSGAYIWVCARYRNVENGWRERPTDPDLALPVRIWGQTGGAVLHVPIVNLGPFSWNDLPLEQLVRGQFYIDRSDDPASFADVQSRCWLGQGDAACARILMVSVTALPRPVGVGPADASGRFVPVSRRLDRTTSGDRWVFLTRRWSDDPSDIAAIDCQPNVLTNLPSTFVAPAGREVCSIRLTLGAARLGAFLGAAVANEAEALAIADRARRDLLRFAAVPAGR